MKLSLRKAAALKFLAKGDEAAIPKSYIVPDGGWLGWFLREREKRLENHRGAWQVLSSPATDLRITKHKKNVNRPRRSRRKEE